MHRTFNPVLPVGGVATWFRNGTTTTSGRSDHQLTDTNVVDSKWRLFMGYIGLNNLGLLRHFRITCRGEGFYLPVQRDIFRTPVPDHPQPREF